MRYYELVMGCEDRWTISLNRTFDNGDTIDIWQYSRCEAVENTRPVPCRVKVAGTEVDYCPTSFGALVVSSPMADVIAGLSEAHVQTIPASIEGHSSSWKILNILACIDCIDHEQSQIYYHPPSHREKPNKPRGVVKLAIDPGRANGHHIFRLTEWRVAVIVSEKMRDRLEDANMQGLEYWRVC